MKKAVTRGDWPHRGKEIIGIILLGLWVLGLVTATTLGGFVHVALVIGAILVIIWLVQLYAGDRKRIWQNRTARRDQRDVA